jgi:hypothetical protein
LKTETTKSPLALREIAGNLTITRDRVVAWFVLPPQHWAFRSEKQRTALLMGAGTTLAGLTGHRLHWRVTSRPYPVRVWAEGLDRNTPEPVGGKAAGSPWSDHLVAVQRHLQTTTLAEKEVLLGVEIGDRPWTAAVLEMLSRKPTKSEREKIAEQVKSIAKVVAGPGIEGAPATARDVEFLLHRSVALGLPAPSSLSPVENGEWEPGDLHAFTDGVTYETAPLGRCVKVTAERAGKQVTRYVAVLTIGRTDEVVAPHPAFDPWMSHADRLPFTVEWSSRVDMLSGEDAKAAVGRRLLVGRDMEKHYAEHGIDVPLDLGRKTARARQVDDEMTEGHEVISTRAYGWHRLAVSGATEDECLDRARQVVDLYKPLRMAVEHPKGQEGLLREFIPGEPLSSTAHRRRLPVLAFAAAMPTVSASLGDRRGSYLGYTCGTSRRAVMFDPHFATEVRETSGVTPIVGGLGAGKSVLMGALAYVNAMRGNTTTLLDPSGPLARLTTLPELQGVSRHVDLLHAESGTLNPYSVVPEPRREAFADETLWLTAKAEAMAERKGLVTDVLRMLLPPQVDAMPETRLVIADAVRVTGGFSTGSIQTVIRNLDGHDSPHGKVIANYLRDMADMPLARLFYGSGYSLDRSSDAVLTVLTMPGLVLPPRGVPRESWSTGEALAVPLLHLAAYLTSTAIYGRAMSERKMVGLDEAHFLGDWGSGRALFTRLARDSRKWNACVMPTSQNASDLLGLDVANFVSTAFVGRTQDEDHARQALRLLRVPEGVGYEATLAGLSPQDRRSTARSGSREFVMRDVDGNVEKMRVDLTWNPALLAALDSTATPTWTARDADLALTA